MGWAVGDDPNRERHIGYGVPATCDHPACGASINRGIAYACGGGLMGSVDNCGLFFCSDHLAFPIEDEWCCERCANDHDPFDPSPETAEWARFVTSDDSWAEWRAHEQAWAARMAIIADGGQS